MTASLVFQLANGAAVLGWLVLAVAVVTKRPETLALAGRWWPLGFSVLYAALVGLFYAETPGGFESLAQVQLMLTSDWAALARWVHYLAFDLLIGSWIAKQFLQEGLPRWPLIVLLPVTFMFGPIGFLGSEITQALLRRSKAASLPSGGKP